VADNLKSYDENHLPVDINICGLEDGASFIDMAVFHSGEQCCKKHKQSFAYMSFVICIRYTLSALLLPHTPKHQTEFKIYK
jgi:hypothetical protein